MDEWDWLGDEDPHKFWLGLGATIAGILLGGVIGLAIVLAAAHWPA